MLGQLLYNIMTIYTYVSYYCSKLFSFVKTLPLFGYDKQSISKIVEPTLKLELVKNNTSSVISKDDLSAVEPTEFDFIMYSKKDKDGQDCKDGKDSVRLFFEIPCNEGLHKLLDEDELKCTYKFISVSIFIPKLDVTCSLDISDYYIVGNKLNKFVLFYLIYLQYNNNMIMDIDSEGYDYTLNIIDHNVKIINLDKTQELMFLLNDYSIV